eukprot:TRINITY_DN110837_c0_g1_i1.p1 TRINITY_DN110837_c0_g1~~TRINITY_DN110837_c0_g1_i1.p1  ORF type:complete len:525 (+),score=114.37 TRINITY_DN110837_c0_g1_i1:178-1752(+)
MATRLLRCLAFAAFLLSNASASVCTGDRDGDCPADVFDVTFLQVELHVEERLAQLSNSSGAAVENNHAALTAQTSSSEMQQSVSATQIAAGRVNASASGTASAAASQQKVVKEAMEALAGAFSAKKQLDEAWQQVAEVALAGSNFTANSFIMVLVLASFLLLVFCCFTREGPESAESHKLRQDPASRAVGLHPWDAAPSGRHMTHLPPTWTGQPAGSGGSRPSYLPAQLNSGASLTATNLRGQGGQGATSSPSVPFHPAPLRPVFTRDAGSAAAVLTRPSAGGEALAASGPAASMLVRPPPPTAGVMAAPPTAAFPGGPPAVCPSLILPNTEAKFVISMEALLRPELTGGRLDIKGSSGRKLLSAELANSGDGRLCLSLASVGCEDTPRARIFSPAPGRTDMELLGKGNSFYGSLQPNGSPTSFVLLYEGEAVLHVQIVDSASFRIVVCSKDGVQLGHSERTLGGPGGSEVLRLNVRRGVDAVLVVSCVLAMVLVHGGSPHGGSSPSPSLRTSMAPPSLSPRAL